MQKKVYLCSSPCYRALHFAWVPHARAHASVSWLPLCIPSLTNPDSTRDGLSIFISAFRSLNEHSRSESDHGGFSSKRRASSRSLSSFRPRERPPFSQLLLPPTKPKADQRRRRRSLARRLRRSLRPSTPSEPLSSSEMGRSRSHQLQCCMCVSPPPLPSPPFPLPQADNLLVFGFGCVGK